MSKEDFELFWTTHLVTSPQGCHLPEQTVLYWHTSKEETSNFPWTRKEGSPRLHATAAVARDLITQVRVATKKNVITATLIQNFSPCSQCADEILKIITLAKEKRVKFDISIAFVALNRIRRPSWVWRGLANATHSVKINESNDNSLALRRLTESGVKLFTFNPDNWKFLYIFLGNGLPVESSGKFLGSRFSNSESRFEEDRLMGTDFRQILKGLVLTSSAISSSNSTLDIEWVAPSLAGEKVAEYRITCKKVTIKNKEEDERSWRIHQTLDKVSIKTTVSGDISSCTLTGLDSDTFYDVTVESLVKGMATSIARKIFRTSNKVPIPSLQTPPAIRKLSIASRLRASTESSPPSPASNNSHPRATAKSTRTQRSNSIQGIPGTPHQASELDHKAKINTCADGLTQPQVGATNSRTSKTDDVDNEPKLTSSEHRLARSNSVRSSTGRQLHLVGDPRRRVSETSNPMSKGVLSSCKNEGSHRKISSVSVDTTVL